MEHALGDGSAPTLRRRVLVGVVGVVLLYGALILLQMVAVPVFVAPDEPAHVDYGIQLTHGTIPIAGSHYVPEFPRLGQRGPQHVSNHPPLYYAITGPVERLAQVSAHPRLLLELTRLFGAVLTAATILLIGRTALLLIRRSAPPWLRATAAVGSAAVAACVPTLVASSSTIQNDSLEVLLAVLAMLLLVQAARSVLATRTVVTLAVVSALGMLTRISFAPVWALCVAGVLALTLWPELRLSRPSAGPIRRALLRVALVMVVPLAGSGWFYLLNLKRYGDLTGGSAVYDLPIVAERHLVPAATHGPLVYLLTPSTWWVQLKQVVGTGSPVAFGPNTEGLVPTALAGTLLAVLAIALVAAVLRLRGGQAPVDTVGSWCLLVLLLAAAGSCLELAVHVTHKGSENNRYLLNGVAAWGAAVVILLLALGRRIAPYAITFVVAAESVGSASHAVQTLRRRGERNASLRDLTGRSWFDTLAEGAHRSGLPAPHLVVAALLVVAGIGLVLVLVSLLSLSRRSNTPDPSPPSDTLPGTAAAPHEVTP